MLAYLFKELSVLQFHLLTESILLYITLFDAFSESLLSTYKHKNSTSNTDGTNSATAPSSNQPAVSTVITITSSGPVVVDIPINLQAVTSGLAAGTSGLAAGTALIAASTSAADASTSAAFQKNANL